METIIKLITDEAVKFEVYTGKKPHNVYLGEVEIAALKKWAYDNDYTGKLDIDLRGENRPEVQGLFVYAVNEITHIECS